MPILLFKKFVVTLADSSGMPVNLPTTHFNPTKGIQLINAFATALALLGKLGILNSQFILIPLLLCDM